MLHCRKQGGETIVLPTVCNHDESLNSDDMIDDLSEFATFEEQILHLRGIGADRKD